jgi:hypothetical protein
VSAVGLTQEQKETLAARCFRSPSEFCRIILPKWFPTKMPWVHRGILALRLQKTAFLLDFGAEAWRDEPDASWTPADLQKILTNFIDEETQLPIFILELGEDGTPTLRISAQLNIGIIMPRGFSKTTIMNAANLHDALYKVEKFFLYLSESGAHAERQLGTIKAELAEDEGDEPNEALHMLFGQHKPGRQDARKWTENYIETLQGVSVGAVGRGGQIRGFNKGARRPGLIVYDDLEDEESVVSDSQRKKDTSWFFGTALPTVRKIPSRGRNIIIGTLLHNDAILNKVIVSPEFTAVRFGAIDRQGEALWAYMMSLEELAAKEKAMTKVGALMQFYMEYMSEYKVDKTRMFPESKMIYVSKPDIFVGMALVQDPAISEESTADFCTFALVGIEPGGVKHVVDYYGEQGMDPAAQIDKFFEMGLSAPMLKIPAQNRKYGIEAVGYQRSLIHLVKTEQFQRTKVFGYDAHFDIIPIFHGKTGKLARVQGILKPLLFSGYLTFQKLDPELAVMFSSWPQGKKDGPDVIAMAISLLDPFASLNLDPSFDPTADTAPVKNVVSMSKFRKCP